MSILTGQYYDIPADDLGYNHYHPGGPELARTERRRFFPTQWGWEDSFQKILHSRDGIISPLNVVKGNNGVKEVMERGGRYDSDEEDDLIEDDDVDEMTLDS